MKLGDDAGFCLKIEIQSVVISANGQHLSLLDLPAFPQNQP